MALPSSPPITAQDINVELGRSPTAAFSIIGAEERALAGVPSGPISFSDFLGKSFAVVTLSATNFSNGSEIPGGSNITVDNNVFKGSSFAGLRFGADGRLYASTAGSGWVQISASTDWIRPADLPDLSMYEVRLTESSGVTAFGGTGVANLGSWLSLDTTRDYEVSQTYFSGGDTTYSNGTIDIRRSGNIVASIGYSLLAESYDDD